MQEDHKRLKKKQELEDDAWTEEDQAASEEEYADEEYRKVNEMLGDRYRKPDRVPEESDRKKEAREVAEALREFKSTLMQSGEPFESYSNNEVEELCKVYLQHLTHTMLDESQ